LAVNLPVNSYEKTQAQVLDFYKEAQRRVAQLPGVQSVAMSDAVPWRDKLFIAFQFSTDGPVQVTPENAPRGNYAPISPGYFATLGVPLVSGRDFNALDGDTANPVVIISKTVADRLFPWQDPVNHYVWWSDPVMQYAGIKPVHRRIVGVVGDVDNVHVAPEPTMTIYEPMQEAGLFFGRMFVRARGNPYALVSPITQLIRGMSPDQPIE